MDFDLGNRLKKLRNHRGLSQRELAKRAGVAHATISLIEQNRIGPSVSVIKRIMQSMGISLAEFFAEEEHQREKNFYRADELFTLIEGDITMQQVGRNLRNRLLQFVVMRFRPGADTGRQTYTHDGEEGGIVLQGRLEVTVDAEKQVLAPGDAFIFSSQKPHRYRNVGNDDCVVFTAGTPPTF